jgi:hypothetical protein
MDQISTELTKTEGKILFPEILELFHSVGIRNNFRSSGRNQLLHLFIKRMIKVSLNRPWRPVGLSDVEAPTFCRQSAHRWW